MQINFLKIQQKSRENGLVIFSKSILRFDEKTLLFSKVKIIREKTRGSKKDITALFHAKNSV